MNDKWITMFISVSLFVIYIVGLFGLLYAIIP